MAVLSGGHRPCELLCGTLLRLTSITLHSAELQKALEGTPPQTISGEHAHGQAAPRGHRFGQWAAFYGPDTGMGTCVAAIFPGLPFSGSQLPSSDETPPQSRGGGENKGKWGMVVHSKSVYGKGAGSGRRQNSHVAQLWEQTHLVLQLLEERQDC